MGGDCLRLCIPATSANLGPGFDSLGLALSLCNYVTLRPSTLNAVHIKGEGENNPKLRVDNSFIKIFTKELKTLMGEIPNYKFVFENSIPISRGLGSSSAVVVGAVYAAFLVAKTHNPKIQIDKQEILDIALGYERHPDNITPACVGGFSTSVISHKYQKIQNNKKIPKLDTNTTKKNTDTQKGHQVYFQRISIPNDVLSAIVVVPNQAISTKFSRSTLPKRYAMSEVVFNLSRSSLLTAAFFSQNFELLREASLDRLHQVRRMKNVPLLFEVQKLALANGALSSTLSGSGSSFLNLCYKDDAKKLLEILQKRFVRLRILELGFNNEGVLCV